MADETKDHQRLADPCGQGQRHQCLQSARQKLGHVEDIDKVSGRACYAVMSFGGFLGIGDMHWPLPWSALNYGTSDEGFVVDIDKQKLEKAPSYGSDDFLWTPDYGRSVDRYYNAPSYWS